MSENSKDSRQLLSDDSKNEWKEQKSKAPTTIDYKREFDLKHNIINEYPTTAEIAKGTSSFSIVSRLPLETEVRGTGLYGIGLPMTSHTVRNSPAYTSGFDYKNYGKATLEREAYMPATYNPIIN